MSAIAAATDYTHTEYMIVVLQQSPSTLPPPEGCAKSRWLDRVLPVHPKGDGDASSDC